MFKFLLKYGFVLIPLISCNSPETSDNADIPTTLEPYSSKLQTGWYKIRNDSNGVKRYLINSNRIYQIHRVPILNSNNFKKSTLFHEKECWAIITELDEAGSDILMFSIKEAKNDSIALIVNDTLVRIQAVVDPQFARPNRSVLAFPCNSFTQLEIIRFNIEMNKQSE